METPAAGTGRVVAIDEGDSASIIEFACTSGMTRRVRVASCADRRAAAQLLRCNRHASWVLLDLGLRPSATVGLLGHRVPSRMRISLAIALGLAEQGVPAYVAQAQAQAQERSAS